VNNLLYETFILLRRKLNMMTKFEAFKLRLSLLKIWFIKNLPIFLELGIFTVVILVLTGQISEDTAILGLVPGLKDLSTAIKTTFDEILTNNNSRLGVEFWSGLATTLLTFLVAVGTLSNGLRRISLNDIKSIKLKRALVQAGLYFNREGKLVKRVEEATRIDLDGDNKIGDTNKTVEEIQSEEGGFFGRVKKASEELGTIMTVKIETKQDVEKIEQKAELKETAKAVESAKEVAISGAISKAETDTLKKTKEPIFRNAVKSFFGRVKNIFKKKPKKEKKVEIKKDIKKPGVSQPVQQKTEEKKLTPAERIKLKYGGK
jgi:hypothetical protein